MAWPIEETIEKQSEGKSIRYKGNVYGQLIEDKRVHKENNMLRVKISWNERKENTIIVIKFYWKKRFFSSHISKLHSMICSK